MCYDITSAKNILFVLFLIKCFMVGNLNIYSLASTSQGVVYYLIVE